MILRQTKAMLIDAYRELNAKKLFWLTMGLNVFAVLIFASLGINDRGTTLLHWTFDNSILNTKIFSEEFYYKTKFTGLGVRFWLSWVSAILALVSTAGIIPDMVSSGTIEPILSKPLGRTRLFLTKYATGLLFVGLQVLVFTAGCFLVIGIRAGSWEFGMFLAIPIVLAFFSYIYSFCALVGLVTRSTITALLLTCLFWSMLFVVHYGDETMTMFRVSAEIKMEDRAAAVERQEDKAQAKIEVMREEGEPVPGENGEPLPENAKDSLEAVNSRLTNARSNLSDSQNGVASWKAWNARVGMLKSILPKTSETLSLLKKNLVSEDAMTKLLNAQMENQPKYNENEMPAIADPRVGTRMQDAQLQKSAAWILSTSFAFEAFLLGLCIIIFTRRDF